jgi:hypothetical protein
MAEPAERAVVQIDIQIEKKAPYKATILLAPVVAGFPLQGSTPFR